MTPEIQRLVPGYITARRADLKRLSNALARNDFANLKGTGSSYGFPRITAAGARMESAARDADPERIRESLAEIREVISASYLTAAMFLVV